MNSSYDPRRPRNISGAAYAGVKPTLCGLLRYAPALNLWLSLHAKASAAATLTGVSDAAAVLEVGQGYHTRS